MEQKKPISPIVAGLILGVVTVVLSHIFASGGGGAWIGNLLIIVGLVVFINLYAKAKYNEVTFGELFSYGFKATALIVLIYVAYIIVFALTNPSMKEEAVELMRQELEKKGNMTDDEIQKSVNLVDKYFWLFTAGVACLVFCFVGAVGSLIGAAVTKKVPKSRADQLDRPDQYNR